MGIVADFVEANDPAWLYESKDLDFNLPAVMQEIKKYPDIYVVILHDLRTILVNRKYITTLRVRKKRAGMSHENEDLMEQVFGEDWENGHG